MAVRSRGRFQTKRDPKTSTAELGEDDSSSLAVKADEGYRCLIAYWVHHACLATGVNP